MDGDNIPLEQAFGALLWRDPILYQCLSAQQAMGLSDRETLITIIKMMADRHAHESAHLERLLRNMPPSPIIQMNV